MRIRVSRLNTFEIPEERMPTEKILSSDHHTIAGIVSPAKQGSMLLKVSVCGIW